MMKSGIRIESKRNDPVEMSDLFIIFLSPFLIPSQAHLLVWRENIVDNVLELLADAHTLSDGVAVVCLAMKQLSRFILQ